MYDVTKYLDEHPGGAEVMLDVAGGDADAFFEDIGHSKDARKELANHLIGTFKMDEATRKKQEEAALKAQQQGSMGSMIMVLVAVAAIVYAYMQMQQQKQEPSS